MRVSRFAGCGETRNTVALVDAVQAFAFKRRHNNTTTGREAAGTLGLAARIRRATGTITLPCSKGNFTLAGGHERTGAVGQTASALRRLLTANQGAVGTQALEDTLFPLTDKRGGLDAVAVRQTAGASFSLRAEGR